MPNKLRKSSGTPSSKMPHILQQQTRPSFPLNISLQIELRFFHSLVSCLPVNSRQPRAPFTIFQHSYVNKHRVLLTIPEKNLTSFIPQWLTNSITIKVEIQSKSQALHKNQKKVYFNNDLLSKASNLHRKNHKKAQKRISLFQTIHHFSDKFSFEHINGKVLGNLVCLQP